MTLPRFRLRTLMVVVAAVAIVLAMDVTRRRMARISAEYRARAAQWQQYAVVAAAKASVANRLIESIWARDAPIVAQGEFHLRQVEYCRAMTVKYQQAADHPWRPVALDPPEPK